MIRIAILDDYQNRALISADWNRIPEADVHVFDRHLGDEDAVAECLAPYEIIVAMRERTPFPASLLTRLPNLRLLVTTGMRNRAVDMDAAASRGVLVCGTELLPHPPAELTWALILALVRDVPREDAAMRAGAWQLTCGMGLKGRVLGIIGLGRQGDQVARVGRAFGMDVAAWSRNLTTEKAAERGARFVEKDELFATADIVTIHVALNDGTRGLVGARELGLMKPKAYLVNTSRGPIVDETALIETLRRKRIAGAGLDVYDREPLPANHPLRSLDNTVLMAHNGYVVEEMFPLAYGQAVEDVEAWLRGAPIRILNQN